MLRIAVCIKQVPLIEDVNFDFERKTIRRDGPNVISAFDLRAIAMAVELKARHGADTTALTMAPPQGRDALAEALAMGLDRAIHLEDRGFAGADTLATARALAAWLERESFDLILLGKYSLDADTGQVGPELAEILDVAQLTGVRKLDLAGRTLRAERESDEGFDEVEAELPALITCAERLIQPIKLTPEMRAAAADKPIATVRLADLGDDARRFGRTGSPTSVEAVRVIEPTRRSGVRLDGRGDPAAAAEEAVALLNRLGVLSMPPLPRVAVKAGGRRSRPGKDVWIAAETDSLGHPTVVTLELATRAGQLAERLGGAVGALLFGAESARHVATLAGYGVDQAFMLDLPEDVAYAPDTAAAAVAAMVSERQPWGLFVPSSERGRDWAPRLAARLGLGLTGDAIGLDLDSHDRLVALKPAFGGNMIADIYSSTFPQMATVRAGMLELGEPAAARMAEVVTVRPAVLAPKIRLVSRHVLIDREIAPLERAEIVIGVGMGTGGPEGVAEARALALSLGGAMCATRKVCDKGWLPRQLQVGLTGKAVNARLYLALGIRGAENHTVGLKRAGTTIAVNNDPEAPIFRFADIGIIGDSRAVVPALTRAFASVRRPEAARAKAAPS